jgi:hypothetical protein
MATSVGYQTVGQNNRNALVQFKKLTPLNEDITWKQPFDNTSVAPGQWNKIRLDLKHAGDRECIINDLRLRFRLDFQSSGRTNIGNVFCTRGTDLIRELVVKFNDDVVFSCDKHQELTHLWLMNNHKLSGERQNVRQSYLLNYGVIPRGMAPAQFYNATDKCYYLDKDYKQYIDGDTNQPISKWTENGWEYHDGLPRLIYSDQKGTGATPNANPYKFQFDISLNELVGPVFTRLHQRRVEFVQIEIRFNPWVSQSDCQDFLLFANNPVKLITHSAYDATNATVTGADAVHPYSVAKYTDMELTVFRSTFLDGVDGFTLPDNRMLSFLMHRYSRRSYFIDLSQPGATLDIPLKDWEIRTNITRMYWMIAPRQNPLNRARENGYHPFGAPCETYDQLMGVEIKWKNDKVLDLQTFFQVYRHYVLSENKRYGLNDPYMHFNRLCPPPPKDSDLGNKPGVYAKNGEVAWYTWDDYPRPLQYTRGTNKSYDVWEHKYEFPVYFVDFNMNVLSGSPGAEIVQGIVNDTSDYVVRLKRVLPDISYEASPPAFVHNGSTTGNTITDKWQAQGTTQNTEIWVWLEYQTLVNLAANSNQFNRSSQVVTKQLNIQN